MSIDWLRKVIFLNNRHFYKRNSCVSQICKQEQRQMTESYKLVIILYSDTHTHTCTHACMHRHTQTHTLITAAVFSSVISALISPCGRCTRVMIPLLRILIGFWWLHWGTSASGHLPNHLAVMTWCAHWFHWCHLRRHDAATTLASPCKCHNTRVFFFFTKRLWFDKQLFKEKPVVVYN